MDFGLDHSIMRLLSSQGFAMNVVILSMLKRKKRKYVLPFVLKNSENSKFAIFFPSFVKEKKCLSSSTSDFSQELFKQLGRLFKWGWCGTITSEGEPLGCRVTSLIAFQGNKFDKRFRIHFRYLGIKLAGRGVSSKCPRVGWRYVANKRCCNISPVQRLPCFLIVGIMVTSTFFSSMVLNPPYSV